ncbi:MAG: phage late control D family protein [Faecalibacterium sp.]
MNPRTATVQILVGGSAMPDDQRSTVGAVTYSDPASGEADSLDISVSGNGEKWISDWYPNEGETISASIILRNWEQPETPDINLNCGQFILDKPNFSGWPISGTLSAVSTPANKGFGRTERTQTWENVTLQEIGKNIASRAGISLSWDAGENFSISSVEQSKKDDCSFFTNLCGDYGLQTKVYANKLVVFDREAYKQKAAVETVSAKQFSNWSGGPSMADTYTGGEYAYTDPQTENEIKVKVGGGDRILKKSGKADSAADAERKIKALVAAANHGHIKISFEMMGNAKWVSTQCIEIADLGVLSGKYYIDRISHNVSTSGGYTMSVEASLCE